MGGFGGFQSFQPFNMSGLNAALPTGTGAAAASQPFKPGSSDFVPGKKQAQGGAGDFPALGQQKQATKKKEDEDPCHGKPKEFFIYDFDPVRNVCICKAE